MNFIEAVKLMKEGKKVRRKEWGNRSFSIRLEYGYLRWDEHGKEETYLSQNDYLAVDWEVFEGKKTLINKGILQVMRGKGYETKVFEFNDIKTHLRRYIDELDNLKQISRSYLKLKVEKHFGKEFV